MQAARHITWEVPATILRVLGSLVCVEGVFCSGYVGAAMDITREIATAILGVLGPPVYVEGTS